MPFSEMYRLDFFLSAAVKLNFIEIADTQGAAILGYITIRTNPKLDV